ncbi:MAG TPA: LysR family transcriptional regulator [Deltaproteobacteria bacterium]|nr:LysR family transcriptional regulator [Deltaproteobacteria bacterium]
MEFGYKIWIEKDGNNVFGMGIYNLLSLVEETGSLHKAAQTLKMSYRAAWGKVRDYEDRLGSSLLEKGRHGRTGANLTPEGRLMLEHFRHIMEEMDRLVTTGPLVELIGKIDNMETSR